MTELRVRTVEAKGLRFYARPGTTDDKVIPEVIERQVYRKKDLVEPGPADTWLDCGGNIGTFALWAAQRGSSVVSYEPEPENYTMLVRNVERNAGVLLGSVQTHRAALVPDDYPDTEVPLYLCNGTANKYRHTLTALRGRTAISVPIKRFTQALTDGRCTAIKFDIEGAEMPILDALQPGDWAMVRKIVMEYHFDRDRSLARYEARLQRLRDAGFTVLGRKMPEGHVNYPYYPAATMVHAIRL